MPQLSKYWSFLFFASLGYYALLLPWQVQWLPVTLGIMLSGLFWLLSADFRSKLRNLSGNKYAAFLFASFLIVVLGSMHSAEQEEASKEVFSKLPFLVWPLMLGTVKALEKKRMEQILRFFVLSTAALVFLSFTYALYRYQQYEDPVVFYFADLLSLTKVPPHYLGMYVTFAYALLMYRLIRGTPLLPKIWLNALILSLFILAIIFIWVRMQYLLFILVNAFLVGQYIKAKKGKKVAFAAFALFTVFFSLLLFLIPGSRSRLLDTYNELRSFEQMVENKQTNPRKFLWHEGLEVISENFWMGVGTGSENTALNEKLEKVDAIFWDGQHTYQLYEMRFNYHNSFLQVFAANGVFAFALFMILLFYPLFDLKRHPYRTEVRLFLGICILSFLTESMLERQAGVLFFSFFYALLLAMPHTKNNEKKVSGPALEAESENA
ncbi:O-antigen ligase family protein [Croceimicrobium sp.]|uniref:O-antigen ligase family protein n=1 Tax=Croceimicrobium sp. TaxID=2828340 RepID=UPI003BAC85AD